MGRIKYEHVVATIVIVVVASVVAFAIKDIRQGLARTAAHKAYLATCDYAGSRRTEGWGARTVYLYDCDGVREESRYGVHTR